MGASVQYSSRSYKMARYDRLEHYFEQQKLKIDIRELDLRNEFPSTKRYISPQFR